MSIADEIRTLRLEKNIPAKAMAEVIQQLYPKFDKTVLSKCEHGDEYGVHIRPDAVDALYAAFAPELLEARKRARDGNRRLTSRVSARLTDEDYEALQRRMRADGYATNQDLLTALVKRYIWEGQHET
ncbi:MAG: hypothetical protein NC131_08345 [Roseburia sp.]|nr:hypothetical protein [Roseburia sp.]